MVMLVEELATDEMVSEERLVFNSGFVIASRSAFFFFLAGLDDNTDMEDLDTEDLVDVLVVGLGATSDEEGPALKKVDKEA